MHEIARSFTATLRRVTSPRVLSLLLGLMGLIDLISALIPRLRRRLHAVTEVASPVAVHLAGVALAITGILLIALSRGVRARRRSAWWAATVLLAGSVIIHLLKGFDFEESILAVIMLVLMMLARRQFVARDSASSTRRIVGIAAASLVIGVVLATVLQSIFRLGQARDTTVYERLLNSITGLIGLNVWVDYTTDRADVGWQLSLLLIGVAVAIAVLFAVLQAHAGPHYLQTDEERRLRDIIAKNKRGGSLDYFALRRDRSVIFSSSGTAAISFRVVGGVCLAGGDPIGEPGLYGEAIDAWLEMTRSSGWLPGVLGASETGARAYQRAGLEVLELGDEAVIKVADFTLAGRSMKSVRNTVNKAKRQGLGVTVGRVGELDAAEIAEVRAAADEWRDGPVERGFSMALGRFADPADGDCVLVRARDAQGRLVGVLHMVPWGSDGLSLDLMRRSPDSLNGTVDTMVTDLVEWCRANRLARISLNFAVFRDSFERGDRLGAGPAERFEYRLLMFVSRFAQLESLYRANAKYEPDWEPRYVCYERAGDLPEVAIAMLRAEAFLTMPTLGRRGDGRPVLITAGDARTLGDEQQAASDLPAPRGGTHGE